MQILNHRQIQQKIKRLAIEILENNYQETEITLIGINNTGMKFAELIFERLQEISSISFSLAHIKINPSNPLDPPVKLNIPTSSLENKTVVMIDDVANSGRTFFYACLPVMEVLPKKVETVVLVDRTHKSFPIKVDYVGIALATTLMEDIKVHLANLNDMEVTLD
jgi:pyrimidine operon attenuation protein/uracil phosphoribosyltransferase